MMRNFGRDVVWVRRLDPEGEFVISTDPGVGVTLALTIARAACTAEWETNRAEVRELPELPTAVSSEDRTFREVLGAHRVKRGLGESLESHELLAIAEHMCISRLERRQVLVRQGQLAPHLILILSGYVEVRAMRPRYLERYSDSMLKVRDRVCVCVCVLNASPDRGKGWGKG